MFNLNPVSMIATVALGPAGGIGSMLASQLFASVGQEIIGRLGQQMGLADQAISFAQTAFSAGSGNFPAVAGQLVSPQQAVENLGNALGASPSTIGEEQRAIDDSINNFVSSLSESNEFREARAGGGVKGGGWLMAMATVLGKELNEMSQDMEQMAGRISKDTPDLTAKFGALSQQFSILMNATTTAIKTVGEAMANTARKG